MPRTRWLIAPTLAVLVSALALAVVSTLSIDWAAWRPATCLPDACFCEAIGNGTIVQPINTWSNLAFVWVGAWVLGDLRLKSKADSENTLKRVSTRFVYQQPNSFGGPMHMFGIACIAIGLGSWFYHASLSFVGQWFDVMSMYLLGVYMMLHAAARLNVDWSFRAQRGISVPDQQTGSSSARFFAATRLRMTQAKMIFTGWYIAINVALGVLLIVWPDARRYVFGVLIVAALILEAISHHRKLTTLQAKWLIAALGVYVVAQVIWMLDLNHIVCDPTSVLQGHAVWHVLTAASAGLLYLYYQSADQQRTEVRR